MSNKTTVNFNCMEITPANGHNPRDLYEHQAEAIKALNDIDKKPEFRTMLVLPTGGGKTLTAVNWLLKNAVDKGKKILWIAHRQLLLEQAAETFSLNAYTDDMINHTVFNYRLVSGVHDKPVNIKLDDNVIIAGKDSIVRSLEKLDKWLNDEDIYFVIDEAHHAVARSYKKIIDYVDKHAKSVKLLGLTATPFRTSEDEKGALKKIFTDDIIYKVDLQELIDKRILAYPYYEEVETKLDYSEQLGIKALQSIENFDKIPEDIAKKIGGDSERNALIVKNYLDHYEKYGQTIVFTVSKDHAVALNKLFNEKGKKYGIKSGFVVSDIRDEATGITISNKDNEKVIEEYSNGNIQVLINVNILTEGTDLPQTHTVFLARPTVSRVLMTQMVGRALRGEKAKGTKEAYIVSFIDNWHDKIAWVNPKILSDEEYFEKEDIHNSRDTQVRWISISKLEEFAMMADANVDTSRLDSIPMIERIPLGMYLLKMDDATYTILIYSSNKEAYSNLIADLKNSDFTTEFTEDSMNEMIDMCMEKYFSEDMIPECKRSDIEHLIKYFSERPFEPLFILLDELDRKKLDASDVAKYIYENDLSRKSEREYIDKLWNEDGSVVPVYFSNQYFFKKMIEIELDKLNGYIKVSNVEPQSQSEIIEARKLSLYELIQRFPKTGIELREKVYNKAKNAAGQYVCACCKKVFDTRQFLHVDHIVPMSKGGLTEEDNLQVLCRTCNMQKGDK